MPDAKLTITTDDKSYDFDGSREVTIGRAADVDVRLDVGFIEEHHATIRLAGDQWTYLGQGRTYRDGAPVTSVELPAKVALTLGKANGIVIAVTATAPTAAGSRTSSDPASGSVRPISGGLAAPGGPAAHATLAPTDPRQAGGAVVRSVSLMATGGTLAGGPWSTQDTLTIGRDPRNTVVLTDPRVSRDHARVTVRDGRALIEDLNSTHGTLVNGEAISGQHALVAGDTVRIGTQDFRASLGTGAGAAADSVGDAAGTGAPPMPPPGGPQINGAGAQSSMRSVLREYTRRAIGGAVAAALIVAVVLGAGWYTFVREPTAEEVIAGLDGQVVRVSTEARNGTGWVLDAEQGLIVTNHHVISSSTTHKVAFEAGDDRDATLVGTAACDDLALLRVSDTSGLRTLEIGDQSALRRGQQVIAVGFPDVPAANRNNLVATVGAVSVPMTDADLPGNFPNVIQHSTELNHGNSGGPLVTSDGRLVGVNTFVAFDMVGQNFSIGAEHVIEITDQLATGASMDFTGLFVEDWSSLVAISGVESAKFEAALKAADFVWQAGLPALVALPGSSAAAAGFGEDLWFITQIDGQDLAPLNEAGDDLTRHPMDGYCELTNHRTFGQADFTVQKVSISAGAISVSEAQVISLSFE